MTIQEFDQQYRRHKVLNEIPQAFKFCLNHLSDPQLQQRAISSAKELIKNYSINVLPSDGKRCYFIVPTQIDSNWIVDIALNLGYKHIEKTSMSIGLFKSINCVAIGSLMGKQKFGVRPNNDGTTTFFYSAGSFASDRKLINAICEDLIQLTLNNGGKP